MSFVLIASKRFNRNIKRLDKKYASLPDDFARLIADKSEQKSTSDKERDDLLRENGLV